MNSIYKELLELSLIMDDIKKLKDNTLDLFSQNKQKASNILIGLNQLEVEAESIFENLNSKL